MTFSSRVLTIVFVVMLVVVGRDAHVAQSRQINADDTTVQRAAADIGEFVAFCDYSHRLSDDPIVFPNRPLAAHSHDFFGNITADAFSTLTTLLAGATDCNPTTDRSSYWVPTLYDAQGNVMAVEHATFYYLVHINTPASLQAYPPGLKIIAGDGKATTPPDPARFKWSCQGAANSSTEDIVACPAGSKLELLINFPDCWNGQDLDSSDHKSHMAYSAAGACPATHPVAAPALQFKLRYATTGALDMVLSSGRGYTAHADFFNAWESVALENRLNCLRNLVKCGPEGYPSGDVLSNPVYLPLLVR